MLSTASLQRDRDKQHARAASEILDTVRLASEAGQELRFFGRLNRDGTLHVEYLTPLKQTGS